MNPEAVQQESLDPLEPAQQPQPSRRRRVTAGALAFVLSAVAAGGLTGGIVLAARSATTPAKPAAQSAAPAAPAFGTRADGSHFGPLGQLLLPVPDGQTPGPDVATFGNDTVLTPDQYPAMFEREFRFLSSGARDSLRSQLALTGVKGYALRTFADTDDGLSLEVTLIQEDAAHTGALGQALKTLDSATSGLRPGPLVTGFPHAHCYQPADPYGSNLDVLRCDDVEGDLLITLVVDGVRPIAQSAASDLLRKQLSRLATPAAQV